MHFEYLVATNAFYIAANIISMLALYNIERLERIDFYQSILLIEKQNEITLINSDLENQVFERTKLLDELVIKTRPVSDITTVFIDGMEFVDVSFIGPLKVSP